MLEGSSSFFVSLADDAIARPDRLLPCLFPLFQHLAMSGHERGPEVREEAVVFSFLFRLSLARDRASGVAAQLPALLQTLQSPSACGRESAPEGPEGVVAIALLCPLLSPRDCGPAAETEWHGCSLQLFPSHPVLSLFYPMPSRACRGLLSVE